MAFKWFTTPRAPTEGEAKSGDKDKSAENFEAPLDAGDIDLDKSGDRFILHLGSNRSQEMEFDLDWFTAPKARDLALKLIEQGVTQPAEIEKRVKKFIEDEHKLESG